MSVIHIKETESVQEWFDLFTSTEYSGLGKTEIVRAILAEKAWEIKKSLNQSASLTPRQVLKVQEAYNSYVSGKGVVVNHGDIDEFLDNTV